MNPSAEAWLGLIALGVVGSALPGVLMFVLLQRVGAEFMSLYGYILPLLGIVVAWIAFGRALETTFLLGLPITFAGVASGSRPIDYSWDYGDGSTGSGNPAVHTYSTPGAYTVTMTAVNCGQQVVQRTVIVVAARRLFLPIVLSRAGAE